MKFHHLLRNALPVLALLSTACATEPEPRGGIISAVQNEDGSFKAVDENGNEVKDSIEADLLLGLLEALQGPSLADDEIWSVDGEGNLTHIQSGGICPIEWGEFRLAKPTIFNRNGMDVGCNYQSESLQASYTFYMYMNPQEIDEELNEAVSTIKSRAPLAKDVELNVIGPEPRYYSGRALETIVDGGSNKRDALLIAAESGWRIKLRMTYSASEAMEREHLGAIMLRGQMDMIARKALGVDSDDVESDPELET